MVEYKKPKIGDKIICIDDDSQNEDLGLSGIVLKGTKGLNVDDEYEIQSLDFSQIPKNKGNYGEKVWSDEEYPAIRWYWTLAWIKGKGFSGRVLLGKFKPKPLETNDNQANTIKIKVSKDRPIKSVT